MLLFLLTLGLVITLQPRLSATTASAQTHSSSALVEPPRSPSEPLSFPVPTGRGIPNLFPPATTEPVTAITRSDEPRFREKENGSQAQPTYLTIDILWILLCSGLVFSMQAGFMCLESGLTRSKNSINVAVKNFTDFGCSVALFWAFGFALMFGTSFQGWIGGSGFFLKTDLPAFDLAFFLFQAMFCGTATTIVSGAVAERMKFGSYLLIACLISGLIYPIFGHWAWNGVNHGALMGWLGKLGFVDFAGSTVVHSVGGWVSLASLPIVGARAGRFPKFGKAEKIHGSNLPISVLGALILWLGWFGFNGGSTLALNEDVARVIVNTVLAGVAGMMTALITGWWSREIPEVDRLINGSLAGLVGITACCHGGTAISAVTILLGMSLHQLIEFGLDVLYWQPDKNLKIEQLLSEIVASGHPHELVGIRADGSKFPVEVSITEAQFRDTTFYTGTFRDITHRKQAQKALEESEERFRRLSGATLEAIIVHEHGKIIDVNQTCVQMFGYPFSDLIDRNGLSLIVPEDRDLVLKHIVTGYEKPYEVTGLKQDGTRFPIEIEGRVLPYEGRELRVAAIRDITERKQAQAALRDSEERFRSVMEQAADGFIIHDLEGQIIEVNHAVCDSLGYSRQELLDRSMADLEQKLPLETLKQRWQQMITGVAISLEGVHLRQDGSTFPVDVRVGLLEAGNRKLLLALCRDITERKQAEIALRNEQEKSERLLLNILPEAIATRLKQEQGTIADGFAEATVLFADIVGFTKLASRISPTELVHLLNDIFSTFDLLANMG